MNKTLSTLIGSSVLAAGASIMMLAPAQAASFTFSCTGSNSDCAGVEGGVLDLTSTFDAGAGNWLYTLKINNTSTPGVGSATGAGITGFGFDFAPEFDLSMLVNNSLSVVRNGFDISSLWTLGDGNSSVANGSSYNGISLSMIDFTGENTGNTNNSAIFNTNTSGDDAIVTFRLTQNLTAESGLLRLQRTGTNGEGSLKLVNGTPQARVPEPGTTAALGLFALTSLGLLKKAKKS